MRTLVLTFTLVLILAAALGLVLKDGHGRPLLLSVLHLPVGGEVEGVPAGGPAADSDKAEEKGYFAHMPGVLEKARQANGRVERSADALQQQMDAADAP